MTPQPQLTLDFEASQRAAERGMSQALPSEEDRWRLDFERAVCQLAASGREFSADDVYLMVGEPPASSGNPNATPGALMNRMARMGVMRHVGYTKSARPRSHANLLRTWRGNA